MKEMPLHFPSLRFSVAFGRVVGFAVSLLRESAVAGCVAVNGLFQVVDHPRYSVEGGPHAGSPTTVTVG